MYTFSSASKPLTVCICVSPLAIIPLSCARLYKLDFICCAEKLLAEELESCQNMRCGKMGPLSISVYDIIIDILDKKKYRNKMVD